MSQTQQPRWRSLPALHGWSRGRDDRDRRSAVVAFAGLNALKTDHDPTPVRAVDYQAMVRAGRADHKLQRDGPDEPAARLEGHQCRRT